MKKIKINGKEFGVKYTLRALFIFEQITNKPFEIKTLLDNYIFFYSLILANNIETPLDWDEFIDALDTDKELLDSLTKIVDDFQKRDNMFTDKEDSKDSDKKKVKNK